jgi:hypothetical protein
MKFNLTLAKVLRDLALKMQMFRRDFFFLRSTNADVAGRNKWPHIPV